MGAALTAHITSKLSSKILALHSAWAPAPCTTTPWPPPPGAPPTLDPQHSTEPSPGAPSAPCARVRLLTPSTSSATAPTQWQCPPGRQYWPRPPSTSPRAKHTFCATPDPPAELTATYEELLALSPAPDWPTAGRALFYRLSLAFPWPEASVDDPNAAHARHPRALARQTVDHTVATNAALNPIANSWVAWGSKSLLRMRKAWGGEVDRLSPPIAAPTTLSCAFTPKQRQLAPASVYH